MNWQFHPDTVYQVMGDHPDWCFTCGSRLELIEIIPIDRERVFVCECFGCQRIIPVVEVDDELLEAEEDSA
jgi:hypothetical protein